MVNNRQDNFNQIYQAMRRGEMSSSKETWEASFNRLAQQIVLDLQPESVLVAGCGRGDLVRALRSLGVEAWGIDSPQSSIKDLLPECKLFCQVGSVLDPFPDNHYDLVVCVDVLDDLPLEQAARAVENLSQHTSQVIISTSPIELREAAGTTALTPDQWAAQFNLLGFVHDLDFDASFISPWAMRLVKSSLPIEQQVAAYERKIWQLNQEVALRRELAVEYKKELVRKDVDLQVLKPAHLQAELDAIRGSTSWKLITRLQKTREHLVPLGSRREKLMRTAMRGTSVLHREGLVGFTVLAYQKLTGKIRLKTTKLWYTYKLRHSNLPKTGVATQVEAVQERPELITHTEPIDIIICVHNALEDVQRCLASVLEHTSQPYRLILVDDGSDGETAAYLAGFANKNDAMFLRSEEATGYTCAANRGMCASSADYVVLLNSDTLVAPDWLDRMAACMQSDPKIGMVGPLSNTASWQSVPKIEDSGDWAANTLPAGLSASGMSQLIAAGSARLFVDMPLLNGFCLMVRRELLDEVGMFDEANFGEGYGEEDDLILRARKQGWKMALADDVYIYHAQSKSYSNDRRHTLSERAQKILRQKHGEQMISEGVRYCRYDPVLEGIRARAQVAYERHQSLQKGRQFFSRRLLFVLPVNSPGGGANVIRTESQSLQRMGVHVDFFNLEENRSEFTRLYPDLSQATIYGQPGDLIQLVKNFDGIIATHNATIDWMTPLSMDGGVQVLGYYVQGFEPLMYVTGSQAHRTALESYTKLSHIMLLTKTEWTRQQVLKATGRESRIVGASVDIDLYRPRPRTTPTWPNGPIKVTAMVRPESPYREPLKTMQLLSHASAKYKGEVEINLFGTPIDNPAFQALPVNFPWKQYGVLSPSQVANLLSQSDIFIDYSSHQAMGLTAMEAMACGCAVIVPQEGGASSYAVHERNSLIVDSSSFDQMWTALQQLIENEELRSRLRRGAIYDICAYYPERAAVNILDALFTDHP